MSERFTLLGQRDGRWADKPLGNSPSVTIGGYGCLLTCFAMLAGWDDVGKMNDCRRATGGFCLEPKGAYASNFDIAACAPHVRLMHTSPRWNNVPTPAGEVGRLRNHLAGGQPAVIEVDFAQQPGLQQHFVLAVGIDEKGRIAIHDPWVGDSIPLTQRYGETDAAAVWRFLLYEVRDDAAKVQEEDSGNGS